MEGPLDSQRANDMAPLFAALADPTRLRIISMLNASPGGSCCGCDLEQPLGLSQPTVSHHLKVLREAGLVTGEKDGRWVRYRVNSKTLEDASEALRSRVTV